jgi:mycofactocin glycosyltransferase
MKPLTYRFRKRVWFHHGDGRALLLLGYPLKVVFLNTALIPLFDHLSKGEWMALGALVPLLGSYDATQVEIFLDGLVRKGFLEREGVAQISPYPTVSIVIPVRNRPREIAACLDSLAKLDYPSHKIEIIVVDDASTDQTPNVVATYPVRLIALKEHRQASFCRNTAAREAQGDLLAFIDSDCLADPLWLKGLVGIFKDATVGAVGGMVDAYYEEKGLDHYEKVKSSLKVGGWFRGSKEGDNFFYVPACNLLVRRDLFLHLDGFKEELHVGEDVDFCWRLRDAGSHVEYRPMGKVFHKHRNRLGPFCSRRFDYGTSEPWLQKFHAERIKHIIFPPGAFLFWCCLISAVVLGEASLLGLVGIVGVVDLIAKFTKIRRKNIPVTLPLMGMTLFRMYLAFFYHLCAFVSRYYLVVALPILPMAPWVSAAIIGMHVLAAAVEYFTRKPRLNPLAFFFYFTLEQASYQLGVWWGCFKHLYFSPLNPRIVSKAPLFQKQASSVNHSNKD